MNYPTVLLNETERGQYALASQLIFDVNIVKGVKQIGDDGKLYMKPEYCTVPDAYRKEGEPFVFDHFMVLTSRQMDELKHCESQKKCIPPIADSDQNYKVRLINDGNAWTFQNQSEKKESAQSSYQDFFYTCSSNVFK